MSHREGGPGSNIKKAIGKAKLLNTMELFVPASPHLPDFPFLWAMAVRSSVTSKGYVD